MSFAKKGRAAALRSKGNYVLVRKVRNRVALTHIPPPSELARQLPTSQTAVNFIFTLLPRGERFSTPTITRPTGKTGDAARGRASMLAGVGPKKIHSALPGGQYAISPTSMVSRAVPSSGMSIPTLP